MKKLKKHKKILLILVFIISSLIGIFTNVAIGASQDKIYQVGLPRSNQTEAWGRDAKTLMNGWHLSKEEHSFTIRAIGAYDGPIGYCIEPGVYMDEEVTLCKKGESYWDDCPEFNNTISNEDVKKFIGRILESGYKGRVNLDWSMDNENHQHEMARLIATQTLIWETVVGERDESFNHVDPGDYDSVLSGIKANHPLRSKILSYYDTIANSIKGDMLIPSFCDRNSITSKTEELKFDGNEYSITLTDTNDVVGKYEFSCDMEGVEFSINEIEAKLTITSKNPIYEKVKITAIKTSCTRNGIITWSDGVVSAESSGQIQDVVSYTDTVEDPIIAYFNIEVSEGNLKLVKESEDGKVSGVKFTVTGNGVNKTVTTGSDGSITIDNLQAGEYEITEENIDIYEPQQTKTVTVNGGQTTTVKFSNKLKKGSLEVIKTAEDNLKEGLKFHLYGTSLSGANVDKYAITNENGIAKFEDIPISTNQGYTLEEVDTPSKYVVPNNINVTIKWNEVTNTVIANKLKMFNVNLNKSDIETTNSQANAKLSGAVYGIYQNGNLIDEYTTDENGKFTTKYYICGENWTIKEISPSEGYLLDNTIYSVGAEPQKYSLQYNLISISSTEQVIKGKISIIKHSDNGETQIETPEVNAKFQVYLKSAGSYENSKMTEKDLLTCNEDGFAQTKLLPYGIYTVHQIEGLEGTEFIKDFDVFISEEGKIYKFLINNHIFESYIKIIKKDAETQKIIPMAGIAFEIYDSNKQKIEMTYTYPEITTIDTFYTNVDGYLITPEKLEEGNYFLKEVMAPYGYVLESSFVPFEVTRQNSNVENDVTVITIEKTNKAQKGTITIEKTGDIFSSVIEENKIYQPLYEKQKQEGAVYEIIANEDIYTPDGSLRVNKGDIVDTITTSENGIAISKQLYLGKYIVKEKLAPQGMVLNTEPYNVELTYMGQEVEITNTNIAFHNEKQKVEIDLNKVLEVDKKYNIGNNKEICDVTFGLFSNQDLIANDGKIIPKDSLIEIIKVDEKGYAKFTTDLPFGKYYVCEIATNEAYILDNTKYEIDFEYTSQDDKTINITINNGEKVENKLMKGKICGKKITEDGEGLANVVIGIFDTKTNKFTKENAIETVITSENGSFEFTNVPYGNWIIKEIETVEGFVLSEGEIPVSITENEEILEIEMTNYFVRGNITLKKLDSENEEKKLSGAIFEVYEDTNKNEILDEEDILLGNLKETQDGIYEMANIKYGLIFVKEAVAPEGYILDENIYKVFIGENEKTYEIENKEGIGFVNDKIVEIPKTGDERNTLVWVRLLKMSLILLIVLLGYSIYIKKHKVN